MSNDKYEEIFKLIEENDTITIFGHIYPDGDCFGSEMGLKLALSHFYPNKKIYAIGGGFKSVPAGFEPFDEVDDATISDSLAIIVDLSNAARINDPRGLTARKKIKIDHHLFTEVFADVEVIEDDRIACAEILAKMLLDRFGTLPKKAAEALYLGITTDSGRFLYQPVDEKLFTTVSRLLALNIDVKKIYDALYEVDPSSLRFKAYVYQNFKVEDGIAYMVFTKEILKEINMEKNQAAVQVNLIGSLKETYAWVFFSEGEDNMVRVELRSNGFPVQPVAVAFNGGGHLQASGCVLSDINDYTKVLSMIKENHARWGKE